ncbi:hypothetical protein AVU38_gp047 [Ralstonia phage RSL2]|uniref:Uncharacterized protein n=1 Tax=Ralstonia phage RSL2 TaxID=1585840 RepID=A0A0A8J851_9CAUD|nr:hypothetical protein AVU38_gp047 [Ralstonia phage RSL2]BAQ02575.1 hypothetical protein [Ralstonia phage RSL2]
MAEITEVAQNAINGAMHHYFHNLTIKGENRFNEASFLGEVLLQTQGWLVFTEDSMQNLYDMIYKDTLYINLVYTLTSLFRTRFTLPEEDYQALIVHLAQAYNTKEADDPKLSFMGAEYRSRIPDPDAVISILKNNRYLVMFAVFFTYGSPEIIAGVIE